VAGKLCALLLLAAVAAGLVQGGSASALEVERVGVVGNHLVPTGEILGAMPPYGSNVFMVKSSRLERSLLANPALAKARVMPALPNTLWVTVEERTPAAIWASGGEAALVDQRGTLLRAAEPAHFRQFPVVTAPDTLLPELGERVDLDAVLAAQSVAPRLDALGLSGGSLEYRPASGINIVAAGKPRVLVGSSQDLEAKLAAYVAINRHLAETGSTAELIDVRFLQRPYYR